jgi:hypothetical protein
MKSYKVRLIVPVTMFADVVVEAENEDGAAELALKCDESDKNFEISSETSGTAEVGEIELAEERAYAIFTPRLATGERLRLALNTADVARVNKHRGTLRVKGVVTDQNTGRRYRIRGASCELPGCVCDSVAREL